MATVHVPTTTANGHATSEMLEAALAYMQADVSFLPTERTTKQPVSHLLPRNDEGKPTWSPYQKRIPDETTIRRWYRQDRYDLASICGKVSGGREVIDIDNKSQPGYPDADTLYAAMQSLVEDEAPGLWEQLAIERTKGGGYHLAYRCPEIDGNTKLAERPATDADRQKENNADLDRVTIIETRGEGGYCVSTPSPGYTLLQGDMTKPPLITPEQRTILWRAARSLNLFVASTDIIGEPQTATDSDDKGLFPGTDYNQRTTKDDVVHLLEEHNWTKVGQRGDVIYMRRPGKEGRCWSATVGYGGKNLFYPFSSNASPFEPGKPYAPFAVYTYFKHNGDFSAAGKELYLLGYGDRLTQKPKDKPTPEHAAQWWAEHHGKNWGYDEDTDATRRYVGTHWAEEPKRSVAVDHQAVTALQAVGLPITSEGRVNLVIRLVRRYLARSFRQKPGLVNFKNGTLDIATMQLRPHNRADTFTYCLPYAYAPGEHPHIDAFLEKAIPDPVARIVFMAHGGLSLLGDTLMHYVLTLIGPTRTGKSTLLALLNALCGNSPYAFAGPSLFSRETEGKRSRGKWNNHRIVCVDELPIEALRDEELFKTLTAHGGVEMRLIGKDELTENQWRPKLTLATNEAPHYKDVSNAIGERMIFIQVPNYIPETMRNPNMLDAMQAELGAFAATCIQWAKLTLRAGFYPLSGDMRALRNKIAQTGNPLKSFLLDCCILGKEEYTTSTHLFVAYKEYCESSGHKHLARNNFTQALEEMHIGIEAKRARVLGKVERCLFGIRLRNVSDPEPDLEAPEAVDAVDAPLTHFLRVCQQALGLSNATNTDVLTQLTHFSEFIHLKNISSRDRSRGMCSRELDDSASTASTEAVIADCNAVPSVDVPEGECVTVRQQCVNSSEPKLVGEWRYKANAKRWGIPENAHTDPSPAIAGIQVGTFLIDMSPAEWEDCCKRYVRGGRDWERCAGELVRRRYQLAEIIPALEIATAQGVPA